MARERIPIAERFWPKVDQRGPDECWLWTAATTMKGYGKIGRGGKGNGFVEAHRVAFELQNGPIPDGHEVHHTCEVKLCQNGAHLRALTVAEHHALDRKTHCVNGHELTPENCYTYPYRRCCRLCQIARRH